MTSELTQRPRWDIDWILDGLVGENIRVAAQSFSLAPLSGAIPARMIPVRDLVLPDNTTPGGLPVFFEGRLQHYVRQIGVVCVSLGEPSGPERSVEGTVPFRGKTAVILRGPATVRLSAPFRVERVPSQEGNYWEDLRFPTAQFKLPL